MKTFLIGLFLVLSSFSAMAVENETPSHCAVASTSSDKGDLSTAEDVKEDPKSGSVNSSGLNSVAPPKK